jgi:hypothetical protein
MADVWGYLGDSVGDTARAQDQTSAMAAAGRGVRAVKTENGTDILATVSPWVNTILKGWLDPTPAPQQTIVVEAPRASPVEAYLPWVAAGGVLIFFVTRDKRPRKRRKR